MSNTNTRPRYTSETGAPTGEQKHKARVEFVTQRNAVLTKEVEQLTARLGIAQEELATLRLATLSGECSDRAKAAKIIARHEAALPKLVADIARISGKIKPISA